MDAKLLMVKLEHLIFDIFVLDPFDLMNLSLQVGQYRPGMSILALEVHPSVLVHHVVGVSPH